MAPEVVNRKGHTFAADWWSFGVLMVRNERPVAVANESVAPFVFVGRNIDSRALIAHARAQLHAFHSTMLISYHIIGKILECLKRNRCASFHMAYLLQQCGPPTPALFGPCLHGRVLIIVSKCYPAYKVYFHWS